MPKPFFTSFRLPQSLGRTTSAPPISIYLWLLSFLINVTIDSHPLYAQESELIKQREDNEVLAIFVHGFTGDYRKTWDSFPDLITSDTDSALKQVDLLFWGYPTRLFFAGQNIGSIGQYLKTEIDYLPRGKYKKIILIGHSMGGLVIRSYIVQSLIDGNGLDLDAVCRVIMFGTPNDGIEYANKVPALISAQINDMKIASDFIVELRKFWIQRVIQARTSNEFFKLIPTIAVAGIEDTFVPESSVKSFFQDALTTSGDHESMVKPGGREHLSYKIVTRNIVDTIHNDCLSSSGEYGNLCNPDIELPDTADPDGYLRATSKSNAAVNVDIPDTFAFFEVNSSRNRCKKDWLGVKKATDPQGFSVGDGRQVLTIFTKSISENLRHFEAELKEIADENLYCFKFKYDLYINISYEACGGSHNRYFRVLYDNDGWTNVRIVPLYKPYFNHMKGRYQLESPVFMSESFTSRVLGEVQTRH